MIQVSPQPGPQTAFQACPADICLFGGQAGGGKTHAILMENARWMDLPGFEAVIFRRESTDITKSGGIWSAARSMFSGLGADLREGANMDATWPSGATVQFRGIKNEHDVRDWQGAELCLACFDELTQFTEYQFWYIYTRLRTTRVPGFKPYLRATLNPEPDSWVRHLIDWWIDKDGFAIPERSGVIRWAVRKEDDLLWFDSQALAQAYCDETGDKDSDPTSITFIPSKLSDNPALLAADPKYRGRLAVQDAVTRAKLLDGNWNARAVSGSLFNRGWFQMIEREPEWHDVRLCVRGWDFAGSAPSPDYPDPDWSATCKIYWLRDGRFVLGHVDRIRLEPGGVDEWAAALVRTDGPRVIQAKWQDPAQSGKVERDHRDIVFRRALASAQIYNEVERENKIVYASMVSAAIDPRTRANQLLIDCVIGPWNGPFFSEIEAFPSTNKAQKKDQVDAFSRAYLHIHQRLEGFAEGFLSSLALVDL